MSPKTTTKRAPAAKPQPMAYVEIAFHGYLVPLAEGQRLLSIIAGAVQARQAYRGHGLIYEVEQPADPVHVSLVAVHPNQVVAVRPKTEAGDAADALALGHEPLKLGGS